ncbi:16S rRNA (adenine(1518)-N(6)/adenine(1519)-N(6))-dimethyltransferase RsmA [Brachyspira hyodysenteriae]|uniref:16S rRNA (adenine(1518)-N(6)/adenine(1519)-N(6))- dimethyltransferase RsmA n=1 Tax=Brachyspira hyodysenteriae TaxID=159 RepID=UPI0022CD6E0B|nr:16S rRNA (adenine(1518)-N(6)/adenine(1519)-N(6))-dimethyltransferase RsmA [Brachyspira hyodysenteriae]MCZ9840329.1 16S rRNA (adenine(1518)-N(6)/adenine(1519)-N(6))-dimethyltransferase RsmA [Brachyspira hyodysenteriae]MCZ9848717.1 16S rRNA (adenine(1518)-N(6)/adenine(1519)-N(6))-dimethyltransferase RsmA [Brachyspira hyodysenteriae]MCZ9850542.1 16S rRNA (adenine(1518)-N(6)/adenine(1519)-N(6))-dimethyltransferase RsmA [Brachyspira hyodysenteriae]MCZ9860706.1 16S rRNA (adenine(1518)-N(6)/adenine
MLDNLYSKREVTEYLKSKSIFPNKNRGQNFLCDKNIAYNIANTIPSHLSRGEYALEIGGGLGSLSNMLHAIYKDNLTIVEYDNALYNHLIEKFNDIKIVHQDILTFDISNSENKYDVYGNIPYNIASPIMEWLLHESYDKWNYAVFMVQSDFAQRLIAKENTENYSSLTLFANFMSNIKLEFNVSKDVFYPIPKVTSSVISIIPKKVDTDIIEVFKSVSKTLFHNRRKTIRNNFIASPYWNIDKEYIDEILNKSNIDGNIRGETLHIDKVIELSNIVKEYI